MSFLKRPEIWFLALLSLGLSYWVIRTDDVAEGNPEPISTASTPQSALTIHRCSLERDYGNARLDIELRYRNASPRVLNLLPPDVRLVTAEGREVPPFILPVEKPAQIPAQTAQDVRLRYWLDKSHLQGALKLEIRGDRAEVKSAALLDLETLENGRPKIWMGAIQ